MNLFQTWSIVEAQLYASWILKKPGGEKKETTAGSMVMKTRATVPLFDKVASSNIHKLFAASTSALREFSRRGFVPHVIPSKSSFEMQLRGSILAT